MKNVCITLTLLFIFPLFAHRLVAQSYSPVWTFKLNALSPIWNNVSGEIVCTPWDRVGLFVGGGWKRAFEDLETVANLGCTEDQGYGIAFGGQYFLLTKRAEKRTIDGIALKSSLNYNLADQIRQTCPSLLPLPLFRTHTVALNFLTAAQKTFFDRIVIEAQVGVGFAVESKIVKDPDIWSEISNETRFRTLLPFALNLGLNF